MRRTSKLSVWMSFVLVPLLLFVAAACATEGETIIVEKEVVKEVQVPGETIIVEKIKEVPVEVVVEKEVVKEVKVAGETIIVEKEVVKEVKVAGKTVIVEKEVVKEVPVEVVVTKEVVKEVIKEVIVEKEVPAPAKEKVLRAMTSQTYINFNPFGGLTGTQEQVLTFLFSTLVLSDPIRQEWSPNLADRWDIAEDGSSYTFYIRKNALWHDGEPVTAKDVKFTFLTHLNPETASILAASFLKVKGAQDFLDGKTDDVPGIVLLDDYTIRFDMEEPTQLFMMSIFKRAILPEHILGEVPLADMQGNEYWLSPVGSGPFKFGKYIPDQLVEVEANDDYYFGRPKLDKIQIIFFRTMDALQIAMQRGEVEWQMRDKFTPEAFTSMFNDPRFKIVSAQGAAFWLYSFSERAADFGGSLMQKNPKFRQAFAMAIDRKEHVDVFELGNGSVINTPIAMHGWFQKPEWADMYPRDVEAAKALLAEIGWDPNEEVEVLTVEVAYLRKYMAAHQQWLADVGIKMKPVFVDGVAFDEKYLSGDYQIIYIADGAPGDPDVWLSSRLMTTGGMRAITGYGDAALDAQILAGRTSDLAERIRVYQEISERLLIDLPYIPMYVPNTRWVISKKFHWPLISSLPEATSVRDVPVAASFQGGDTVRWHVEEWDLLD